MPNKGLDREQYWYAIYTKKAAEAKLHDCILSYSKENDLGYQTYLPLTMEIKQWSDRKKQCQRPLFNNYLFVKHDDKGFAQIKTMPGFCDYIRFGQYPAAIPQAQISMIKTIMAHHQQVTCQPKRLVQGDKVRICTGPLADYEGILVCDQGSKKVALEVKNLGQCLQVHVALDNIAHLNMATCEK
ncbi:MAG: transcription antitermination factor NusG [Phenylobacterium sp.]